MNGSTHLVANVVDIQLKRGPSGKIENSFNEIPQLLAT